MARIRLAVAMLLAAVLIASASFVVTAQDGSQGPEGPVWQLTQYSVDDSLVAVPGGVSATLLLDDGRASGSAGCNTFSGTYQIDGGSIAFGSDLATTLALCEGDAQTVEDAYLATLPVIASWAIADGALSLSDADGVDRLVYGASTEAAAPTDLGQMLAVLVSVQAQLAALDARIEALEGGDNGSASGGGATQTLKKPKPLKAKGKVQTRFPDWMRDEFRPQSERSNEKNRDVVTWNAGKSKGKADIEVDGVRVYARRGFCILKPGADPGQALDPDKDFTTRTGKALLIDELAATTKRYRPDHAAIDAALPTVPESPYSNDQYYDILVAPYNAKGESKKTKVASFFLTPEFRCP